MPGKKSKSQSVKEVTLDSPAFSLIGKKKSTLDPTLASLFSASSGPVQAPPKPTRQLAQSAAPTESQDDSDNDISELESEVDDAEESGTELVPAQDIRAVIEEAEVTEEKAHPKRKRKRADDDNLEGAYLQKLAREEEKETAHQEAERKKRVRVTSQAEEADDDDDEDEDQSHAKPTANGEDLGLGDIPKHESLTTADNSSELDKAARTIFLGNVSTEAIISKSSKKTLLNHLASFIPSLPPNDPPHKVESLRFRSTAFATAVPKKAAFANKDLMDSTTKSTNAYAVYSTKAAAREAARRLNGSIVLERHLRVDEVAHPAKVDHRRCVFVGNLGFVDDASQMNAAAAADSGKKSRKTPPSDVEEGLWVQFGKAGDVESVRVVRDAKTRVGKGFAYVQFKDQNGVEAALLYNDKKYPPLLPRKLRVTRAKKPSSTGPPKGRETQHRGTPRVSQKPAVEEQSLRGRAGKLLGRAGAAEMRSGAKLGNGIRKPEGFVFEGHRASSKQGNSGLRLGGGGRKKSGRPVNRSAKRGADWKAKAKPAPK